MAGDWIKLRIDLQSHPKVVRILSATRSDKFRVIGGLHAVWSVFDVHSEDGSLKGYTPEALDHVIGWDGFSRAMESVGWLLFDGLETLTLPEFGEHNGQSAKRRAEDQKRKRDSRKDVRNMSADESDEKRTREEKRRKEQKQPQAALSVELPDWVDREAWDGFAAMRKRQRHPLTDRAAKLVLGELEKLSAEGYDAADVLDQSTRNGWRDVYPIKAGSPPQPAKGKQAETPDFIARAI
jgi:hypothetical protein